MKEGTVVLVTGKLDSKIKELSPGPHLGTYHGITVEKKAIVMLTSGDFVYLSPYEIAPIEEQTVEN